MNRGHRDYVRDKIEHPEFHGAEAIKWIEDRIELRLAGKEGLPDLAAYSAASAGIIALTKALSREVSDTPIRINCVAPGTLETEAVRNLFGEETDAFLASEAAGNPSGRNIPH